MCVLPEICFLETEPSGEYYKNTLMNLENLSTTHTFAQRKRSKYLLVHSTTAVVMFNEHCISDKEI